MPVYEGGPVHRDSLFYVHTLGGIIPDSIKITDDLSWGGNFETVRTMMSGNIVSEKEIRLFLGYSGWAPLQLENEIKKGAWLIAPAMAELVFDKTGKHGNSLWHEVVKSMGKEYSLIANFPENPLWN